MKINYAKKGKMAIFTINRPEVMNAIDPEARQELHNAVVDFSNNSELWVGIITGAGDKAFCAGNDLRSTSAGAEGQESSASDAPTAFLSTPHIVETWKPVIAAINGYCLGAGLEIALTCDIRIAAEHARFGMPEVTRGFIGLGGGPLKLPRLLHWCHAAEILLTGKHLDAQEAYRMGLVNKVVTLDELMPTAMEWAETICQAAPLAVRAIKEVMTRGYSMTLEDGQQLVTSFWNYLRSTEDYTEGRKAFFERRKPEWKAR